MAGIKSIKQKLEELGFETCDDNVSKIMDYVKSREKGNVSNEEISDILLGKDFDNIMFV